MKFEGITPEIIWANKESIFLVVILLGFGLLLISFKNQDKTQIGSAMVTQSHLEGVQRDRVYTIEVRKNPSDNKPLFTTKIKVSRGSSHIISSKQHRIPFSVKYKKAPDGSWMIMSIAK